jgi:hypothetical protein
MKITVATRRADTDTHDTGGTEFGGVQAYPFLYAPVKGAELE